MEKGLYNIKPNGKPYKNEILLLLFYFKKLIFYLT